MSVQSELKAVRLRLQGQAKRSTLEALDAAILAVDRIATLGELAARCKGGATLEVNPHRGMYQTVAEYLDDRDFDPSELPPDGIAGDDLYILQFYPDSAVGMRYVLGPTLEYVLSKAAT
jgi:hypothetical protein